MPTRPYYYWRELRVQTTSNAQFTVPPPFKQGVQATRRVDDEYVRSLWCAHVSYEGDGTGGVPSWYGQAVVRLVIQWDPTNAGVAHDVGSNFANTLGYTDLLLTPFTTPESGFPVYRWHTGPEPLVLETARAGTSPTIKPAVLAQLYYLDQNGYFAGAAEVANIRRLSITGRVLWRSSSAV